MTFKPVNRHLLVLPKEAEENKTKSGVLLPEEYKADVPLFEPVTIVVVADDCADFDNDIVGKTAIVQSSMLEEIKFCGYQYFLVKENYVLGFISDE